MKDIIGEVREYNVCQCEISGVVGERGEVWWVGDGRCGGLEMGGEVG